MKIVFLKGGFSLQKSLFAYIRDTTKVHNLQFFMDIIFPLSDKDLEGQEHKYNG